MDEAVFVEHALPQIDFVIKRNEMFLANVVSVIKEVPFKFSLETAKQLSISMLNQTILFSENPFCQDFLETVCANVVESDKNALSQAIVQDFMGNIYTSNRNNAVLNPIQKLNLFLDKIFPTLRSFKSFDAQVLQSSISSFLDFIITMGYKDEFNVNSNSIDLIVASNEVQIVSDLVIANVSKISTAS
jgi:hypothetical protein